MHFNAASAGSGFEPLDATLPGSLRLRPAGIVAGSAAKALAHAGAALPLAGGELAFTMVEALGRRPDGVVVKALGPLADLRRWSERAGPGVAEGIGAVLDRLAAPRLPWAGLALDRPRVMGIVNVTPDSFSDGGEFAEVEAAVAHGLTLREAGADILDVGGESTRPGAVAIDPETELRRVEPVVRALAAAGAAVSIDTRHARVMAAAVAAGARIINDVSALTGDADSLRVAAAARVPVVLMHMQGEPRTMQDDPRYDLASLDILDYLAARVAACEAAGIPRAGIVVDPGIGFGKRSAHNLEILARIGLFHGLGCGVLLGVSRKGLIAGASRGEQPQERVPGSLAAALHALARGIQIVRVHDVAQTRQAIAVWQAIAAAS